MDFSERTLATVQFGMGYGNIRMAARGPLPSGWMDDVRNPAPLLEERLILTENILMKKRGCFRAENGKRKSDRLNAAGTKGIVKWLL